MKNILSPLIALAFMLWLSNCGDPLLEVEAVPTVSLSTGQLAADSITITGQINAVGDGIVQHGHVWSSTNNPPTTADNVTQLNVKESAGPFTSRLEFLEPNKTQYIRGYAIDKHGRTFYGEVIILNADPGDKITAGFTVANDNCEAPCTQTFTNTSINATTYRWYVNNVQRGVTTNFSYSFNAPGQYQIKLVATGPLGKDSLIQTVNIKWNTFEVTLPAFNYAVKAVAMPDGGFMVVGVKYVDAALLTSDIVLVRIDRQGSTMQGFPKTISDSDYDTPGDMIRLSDGSFVIVGSTQNGSNADVLYMRLSEDGNFINGPTRLSIAPNNGNEQAKCVTETPDGSVVIAGSYSDPNAGGTWDVLVTKVTPGLDIYAIPMKRIQLVGNEFANDVALTNAGEILIVGSSAPINGKSNAMLMKLNSVGSLVSGFPKDFGGSGYDVANSVSIESATSYVFCGNIQNAATDNDIYLVKTNQTGTAANSFPKSYGNTDLEYGNDMLVLADGSFLIAGEKNQNAYLLSTKADGTFKWDSSLGTAGVDTFYSVTQADDGGLLAVGTRNGALYIAKLNDLGKIQ